jgi:hypothetical protein
MDNIHTRIKHPALWPTPERAHLHKRPMSTRVHLKISPVSYSRLLHLSSSTWWSAPFTYTVTARFHFNFKRDVTPLLWPYLLISSIFYVRYCCTNWILNGHHTSMKHPGSSRTVNSRRAYLHKDHILCNQERFFTNMRCGFTMLQLIR